jgi:hypothetical protein
VRRRALGAVVVALAMGGCATAAPPPAPPPGPGFDPTDVAWLQLAVPMAENAVAAAGLAPDHADSPAVRSVRPPEEAFLPRLRAARDRAGLPAANIHDGHRMPGMITGADLAALRTSHGAGFDQRLLGLLRANAAQLVVLSRGEQASGADPATRALAGELGAAAAREGDELNRTSRPESRGTPGPTAGPG